MKNHPEFSANDFSISTFCASCSQCVEVAHKEGTIAIRDSKNPQSALLYFNKDEWAAFVAGVKNGEFDY